MEEVTVYVIQNGSQRLIEEYGPVTLLEWSQITLEKRDHNGEYWHLTNADSEEMIDAAMALECDASASYISWEIVAVEEARLAARQAADAALEAQEAWEAAHDAANAEEEADTGAAWRQALSELKVARAQEAYEVTRVAYAEAEADLAEARRATA